MSVAGKPLPQSRLDHVANGSLIVNFSEGGVIRSRMQEAIVKGAWHHYDTKNYRYQLGFTCL